MSGCCDAPSRFGRMVSARMGREPVWALDRGASSAMLKSNGELDAAAVRRKVESADTFAEALGILQEITSHLGFTQVLYAYQSSSPRLPNGEWLPLKLNVRN